MPIQVLETLKQVVTLRCNRENEWDFLFQEPWMSNITPPSLQLYLSFGDPICGWLGFKATKK